MGVVLVRTEEIGGGHVYNFEAISGVVPTTHFSGSIRIAENSWLYS